MAYDGQSYVENLFIKDGIHLNPDGQLRRCTQYIQPKLAELVEAFGLTELVK